MTERSIPVPVWNSTIDSWEPIDFRDEQRVVEWTYGFRQELLPIPEYKASHILGRYVSLEL